jgi:hypothetical protein
VGASADGQVSKAVLDATDVVIEAPGDVLRLAVPIMSYNERLGVLIVDYRVPEAQPAQAAALP